MICGPGAAVLRPRRRRLAEPRGERVRRDPRRALARAADGQGPGAPHDPRHRRLDPLVGSAHAAARQALRRRRARPSGPRLHPDRNGRPTSRCPAWRARRRRSSKTLDFAAEGGRRPFGGRGHSRAALPRRRDRAVAARQPQRRLSAVRGRGGLPVSPRSPSSSSSIRSRRGSSPGRPIARRSRTCCAEPDRRSIARGVDLYARLFGNPAHVAGAIGMMANWDLSRMSRDLPKLEPKVVFIVGEDDKAVSSGRRGRARRGHSGRGGRDRPPRRPSGA